MGNLSRGGLAVICLVVAGCTAAQPPPPPASTTVTTTTTVRPADPAPLVAVEGQYGIRLGVYAVNVHTGQTLSYREDERFPIMSVFKGYAAAAVLARRLPLDTALPVTEADVVPNSPVSDTRVDGSMTIAELCEAAVTVSDNTAANLLLKQLGGPAAITEFARSIKDEHTRLDRWEPELNSAIPGDDRDTTTPAAIANGYRALILGDALDEQGREQFKRWHLATKTGAERIRAGLPADWTTADKTGTGSYGSANDVAVTWTPDGTPIVLAVLTTKPAQDADYDNAALAAAAKVAAEALTP